MKKQNEELKTKAKIAKKRLNGAKTIVTSSHIDQEVMALKQKIQYLLECDKDTATPISKLIDYNKFNALSSTQKQKYIFDLSEFYTTQKAKFDTQNVLWA